MIPYVIKFIPQICFDCFRNYRSCIVTDLSFFVPIQEIQNQLARQSKEEEEIQKRREKERENEEKAQQKYKSWLKKKNQEKMQLEKREKVTWTLNS